MINSKVFFCQTKRKQRDKGKKETISKHKDIEFIMIPNRKALNPHSKESKKQQQWVIIDHYKGLSLTIDQTQYLNAV